MSPSGNPEGAAQEKCAPWHGGLIDRTHGPNTMAYGGGILGIRTHEKPRTIDKMNNRQMKCFGQIYKPGDLHTGVGGPKARVLGGIARHERHGPTVHPCKPCNYGTPEVSPHFEKRAPVHKNLYYGAHLISLADVSGNHAPERIVHSIRIIRYRTPFRQAVNRIG